MGPSLYSTTPTARALLFKPSSRNSNLAIRGSSHLAVTAEKITQGPPDLPSSNVATAFRCAPLAFSSRTASDVTFPLCSGPGECPSHTSETPSSVTLPKFPFSTCQRYPPSQNPRVGCESKLHGQPQSQLHAPRSVPFITHFVPIALLLPCLSLAQSSPESKDAAQQSPRCKLTVPPVHLSNVTSRNPTRRMSSASSSGDGNRATEFGRYA